MATLISLLIVLVILSLVCWVISVLPLPASAFPIRNLLYIAVAIIAIMFLLRIV